MVFPFANLLDYSEFSLIYSKRDVPNLPALLRNVSVAEQARRSIMMIRLSYSVRFVSIRVLSLSTCARRAFEFNSVRVYSVYDCLVLFPTKIVGTGQAESSLCGPWRNAGTFQAESSRQDPPRNSGTCQVESFVCGPLRNLAQVRPSLLSVVHCATQARLREGIRKYKRGFIWFRPDGLAYEYTLAALGERLVSYLKHPPDGRGATAGRGKGRDGMSRGETRRQRARIRRNEALGAVPAGSVDMAQSVSSDRAP